MTITRSFYFILALFFYVPLHAQVVKQEVTFESANPFSLSDIILNLNAQEKQTVFGQLSIPMDSLNPDKKYPLIIGVAGSLGWRKHHLEYMEMYQQDGFATFELNSFKSRDITSTVGSQDEVTIAAIILDAYRALEKLAEHPNIDKEKVSITGWSLGGGVSLFSGWMPVKNAITTSVSFASHLAFYPPCFINPENLAFTQEPIHILIGEKDNWTPAAPCSNLIKKLEGKANIALTTYPESHHSFDSETPVTRNEKGYSFKDCLFTLTEDGDVLMNYLQLPMSSPLLQKLGFMFCVEQGVDIGGNPAARKKAFAFAKEFMHTTLKGASEISDAF
ncbi:dienelactone hydrolase family protein [Flavobacteriaceae bacterium]|nr:dienelactone hydrolase family protein [Flavobacteriaceae bacterium]|tara:strand:+ start:2441 stop:3439 length:999 start_codon:yes stop_codon:yes gene_type:complete